MNSRDITPWVPFGLYDFFGYLFPGMFIFASAMLYFKFSYIDQTIINTVWNACKDNNILLSVLLASLGIVFIYVIGHVLATLSSILYGCIISDGIIGYPYVSLLKIPCEVKEYSRASHGYSLLIINVFILLPLFVQKQTDIKLVTICAIYLMALLFTFRLIIAILENKERSKRIVKKIADNKCTRLFLLPHKIIELYIIMIKKLISVDKTFSANFVAEYKIKFKKDFNLNPDEIGSDNFWLPFHKVNNSTPENVTITRNWLHLYGFSRNISMSAYMVCFLIVITLLLGYKINIIALKAQLIATYFIAWISGLGYWRIFYTYYTKSIIRAYMCLPEKSINEI